MKTEEAWSCGHSSRHLRHILDICIYMKHQISVEKCYQNIEEAYKFKTKINMLARCKDRVLEDQVLSLYVCILTSH
jgi:hypothetical protein